MGRTETNERLGRSPPTDLAPREEVDGGRTGESARPQTSGGQSDGNPVISVAHTEDTNDTDTITVHMTGVGLEFVREGLLATDGPTDWADRPIRTAVADAGFDLDSYDRIHVACPDTDELIDVSISCSVSPETE